MTRNAILLCIVVAITRLMAFSQQQDDFPVGVFLFEGINVDYHQMKNSLNLTWVQGYTGSHNVHYPIDTNSAGLKVISMRGGILQATAAQRMRYEAEENANDGLKNYFGTKETGTLSEEQNAWQCIAGGHSPGYMVRHPRPNNDFHYDQSQYYATFRMAIQNPQHTADTVAVLSIRTYYGGYVQNIFSKVLRDSNFAVGFPQYYEFRDTFFVMIAEPFSAPPESLMRGILKGGAYQTASNILCDSMDICVDWRGYRTTWLDNVITDDSVADNLFSGRYDALIGQEVYDYRHDSRFNLMQRLYTHDEPFVPSFFPYNYVDNKLRDSGFVGSRGRTITANYWTGNTIQRFIQDARPNEILVDPYVITTSVPSPSMTDVQASDVGVEVYQNNSQYNSALQIVWNHLEENLGSQAIKAKAANIPLWHIPQLHGIYRESDGHYYSIRPPTGTEIQAQINIGIALGSKGVVSYPYGTDNYFKVFDNVGSWGPGLVSRNVVNGKYTDHSKDTAWLPFPGAPNGRDAYTGYKEKWDSLASINKKLQVLGQTLKDLTWQGAKSWWPNRTYGEWSNIITSVGTTPVGSSPDAHPYPVLTGHMKSGPTDYIYVVNRLCDNGRHDSASIDIRNIELTMTTSLPYPNLLVTDVYTGRERVVLRGRSFTDTFQPGEGKLYKISNGLGMVTAISGWQMLSVPVVVRDFRKSIVWPTAASNAFEFDQHHGYIVRDTLRNGPGYWVKFDSTQIVKMFGSHIDYQFDSVSAGWNLVGSISDPILASTNLCLFPAWNTFTSQFFTYRNGYVPTDSIIPGVGPARPNDGGTEFGRSGGHFNATLSLWKLNRSIERVYVHGTTSPEIHVEDFWTAA